MINTGVQQEFDLTALQSGDRVEFAVTRKPSGMVASEVTRI